ncbi:MAG: adenylate/guanylate cyclase domain-containing protein, partial [Actinobacteria bacterium]|nr:adenylate/guanylate cyclase domain-containing protein [Actinomycetota bacterium]
MKRSPLFRIAVSIAVAAVVTLLAWPGLSQGVLGTVNLRFGDSLYPAAAQDPRIAVVGIDEQSLRETGEPWPWRRDLHAQIIRKLREAGAGLIVYDLVFNPGSEDPAIDRELAAAIAEEEDVILAGFADFPRSRATGSVLVASGFTRPVPPLEEASAAIGHANVSPDIDGVIRALPVVIDVDGELQPSLSLAAFERLEGVSPPYRLRPDQGLQVGDRLIQTEERQIMNVNYTEGLIEGAGEAPVLSASDVLANKFAIPLSGKVVFVGVTDPTLGDNKLTPVEKTQGLPGVFVHANALNTMLQGAYVAPAGLVDDLVAVFAVTLLVALAVQFLPLTLSWIALVVLGAGFLAYTFQQFEGGRLYNMIYPNGGLFLGFMGSLGVKYLTELRERRRVLKTFGRYVAKDIVEEVLAAPNDAVATLKGAMRPLSVLFADLRGFTAASENAMPGDVVAALNVYLDAMTRAVTEEKGTIDKFMGDCVMAFWGAPKPDPDYADRAVRAGIKMLDYIDEAVVTRPETKLLQVKGCGVGISAGMAVVGNIGSQERLDYTAIGDTVN